MSETTAEETEYVEQMLAYEAAAYDAAASENYDFAIERWNEILNTEDTKGFFDRAEGALDEIRWNLAVAYWAKGDDASRAEAERVLNDGGLSFDEFKQTVEAEQ